MPKLVRPQLLILLAAVLLTVELSALPLPTSAQESSSSEESRLIEKARNTEFLSDKAGARKLAASLIALRKFYSNRGEPRKSLAVAEELASAPNTGCGNCTNSEYQRYLAVAEQLMKRHEMELANIFFRAGSYAYPARDEPFPPPLPDQDGLFQQGNTLPSFECASEQDIVRMHKIRRPFQLNIVFGPENLALRQSQLRALSASPMVRSLHLFGFSGDWVTDETIALLPHFPNLEELHIVNFGAESSRIQLHHLNQLSRFESLQKLNLVYSVTDDSFRKWIRPPHLTELRIVDERITDRGIASLPKIPTLRKFDVQSLEATGLTNQAIDSLVSFPNLEELRLPFEFNEDSLQKLTKLHQLKTLQTVGVSDIGLVELLKLQKLRQLTIYSPTPSATAVGWNALARLPQLSELKLAMGHVNDEAVAAIAATPQLTSLELSSLPITFRALQSLQRCANIREILIGPRVQWDDEWLEALGGIVTLRKLPLAPNFRDLKFLTRLQSLEELTVDCAKHPEQSSNLRHFQGVRSIRMLEPSDDTLVPLAELTNLTNIDVGSEPWVRPAVGYGYQRSYGVVTDKGLASLGHLPKLETLDAKAQAVRGDCFSGSAFTALRKLTLDFSRITDEGLAKISQLHSLGELSLAQTTVSSTGVQHLASCVNLTSLDLQQTPIDDSCVPALASLKKLADLDLRGTKITISGLQRLERELPETAIVPSPAKIRLAIGSR